MLEILLLRSATHISAHKVSTCSQYCGAIDFGWVCAQRYPEEELQEMLDDLAKLKKYE